MFGGDVLRQVASLVNRKDEESNANAPTHFPRVLIFDTRRRNRR